MNSKERIKDALEGYLAAHPEDTKEFLDICSSMLSKFMEAQKSARDGLAWNSIHGLFGANYKYQFKPKDIPCILDSFVYFFPKGWDNLEGHTGTARHAFKRFLNAAEEYKLTSDKNRYWIDEIKQCREWVDKVFNHPDYEKLKESLDSKAKE